MVALDIFEKTSNLTNMNTDTVQEPVKKVSKRGRKATNFAWPQGEFSIKALANELNRSIPFLHKKITEAGKSVVKVRHVKSPSGRGRQAAIYKYVQEGDKVTEEIIIETSEDLTPISEPSVAIETITEESPKGVENVKTEEAPKPENASEVNPLD